MRSTPPLYLAVSHFPVLNRNNEVITSTIDHFDFFDASRLTLTYPTAGCYFVNPLPAQRDLAMRLIDHAQSQARDVDSRGSFDKTHWAASLAEVSNAIEQETKRKPVTVVTTAKPQRETISHADVAHMLKSERPVLVVFGKSWGLTAEAISKADHVLEPIETGTGYNHLSLRSALSITVDRIHQALTQA